MELWASGGENDSDRLRLTMTVVGLRQRITVVGLGHRNSVVLGLGHRNSVVAIGLITTVVGIR